MNGNLLYLYFHPFINTHPYYKHMKNVVLVLVKFHQSDFPFWGSNHSEDFNFRMVDCRFDRLIEWINWYYKQTTPLITFAVNRLLVKINIANQHQQSKGVKIQLGLEFSHVRNFTSWWIYLSNKRVNLCSNDTMRTRIYNELRTTDIRSIRKKFNNVKEGKIGTGDCIRTNT